jgi:hypothetical protein
MARVSRSGCPVRTLFATSPCARLQPVKAHGADCCTLYHRLTLSTASAAFAIIGRVIGISGEVDEEACVWAAKHECARVD